MKFDLIDAVLERGADHIVTLKHVSRAEEYLADHFPTFPVLPGVFMLEAMTQSARLLAAGEGDMVDRGLPPVLGEVKAFRYGSFVAPGSSLVTRVERSGDGLVFKGRSHAVPFGGEHAAGDWASAPVAAAGKLTLRAVRFVGSVAVGAAVSGSGNG